MNGEPGAWAAAVRSVDPEKLGPLANRLLLAEGIDSVEDASREMLLNEIAKALKQGFESRQRHAEGDYGPDPMARRFPEFQGQQQKRDDAGMPRVHRSSSLPKVSLMGLVEDWWREAKAGGMSLSTYESYRNTARKFGLFVERSKAGYLFLDADPESDWALKRRGKWRAAKNRLTEFVRTVVTDPNVKPLHGFRHSFKTIGREAGIEDSVLDAICGHAPSSVEWRKAFLHHANRIPYL
jgi:hypothetical protein